MNLLYKLISPVTVHERIMKKGGLCFAVLFLISVAVYGYNVLCIPLAAISAIAAGVGVVIFKWKLHSSVMQNSIVIHAISLSTIIFSLQPADYYNRMLNEYEILLTGFSSFFFYLYLSELCFSVLLRLFGGRFRPESFWKCWLISLVPCFTVLLFLSSETYLSNRDQMYYSYWDFAPHYCWLTLLVSLSLTSVLCTFRKKWIRRFSCGITGFLLCVYSQYMFLNKGLPLVGADTIDWNGMTGRCIWNAVIWLLLLVLPFLLERVTRKKEKNTAFIPKCNLILSGVLGGIQFLTLFILNFTAPPAIGNYSIKRLSGEEQFVVSSKQNIITIILDAADQCFFEEAYAEQPERFDFMHDFTYYTNTAMQYDSTFLSIPAMLTAARTIADTDVFAWYDDICSDEPAQTFYQRLHDANYKVNAFGSFAYRTNYSAFEGLLDNVHELTSESSSVDKDLLYNSIFRMIAYRALPMFLKQYTEPTDEFGNNAVSVTQGCITENHAFLENLNLQTAEDGRNYFTVQHLAGMHALAEGPPEENLQNCLDILRRYFDQLKALGVYDNALIIVTADHGKHSQPTNMPIWYIKKPNDKYETMQFCNAPISLTDYTATVLDAVGLDQPGDEALFGRSVFAIGEDEMRTRLVFQFKTFQLNGNPGDVPDHRMFGYYYTGTKEDLLRHEQNDPPDIIMETTVRN